jgi:hypothetical protein
MTSVLDRATVQSSSDHFVGRKYVQLVLVLGALSAIGPLTIDTYLPALPELTTDLSGDHYAPTALCSPTGYSRSWSASRV